MNVLVLNCGSSSIKYQVINMKDESLLAKGLVERIGGEETIFNYQKTGSEKIKNVMQNINYEKAISVLLNTICDKEIGVLKDIHELNAIGHRVVHGGEYFFESQLIDEEVEKRIEECIDLAPLHNPANLEGIKIMRKLLPEVPNIAVFDTAFHQTMPKSSFIYPIPYNLYNKYKIRRYGFHGTSHKYVAEQASLRLGKPLSECNLITCHLGNGCSITAIKNGLSIDTSMGFTPLEGLMMGTRSGDIDPYIVLYLMEKENLSIEQVNSLMNKQSGLLGISGISNDIRLIWEEEKKGNDQAKLATELFIYRLRKYIGSYMAVLGHVDAIVFTAGIGENDEHVRERALIGLEELGIFIDLEKNIEFNRKEGEISKPESKIKVYIIPTNEELAIARDTKRIVESTK
ncbi:MAG: acetate kinase [Exilispira sp.]